MAGMRAVAGRGAATMVFALVGLGFLTGCSDNMGDFDRVRVTAAVSGTGTGHIVSDDDIVGIDCPSACDNSFAEAGAGGQFNLRAVPDAGSILAGWSGDCLSAGTSPVCLLSFPPNSGNVTFTVGAQFDLAPAGPTDALNLYNGTAQPANVVLATEVPSAANSLGPSAQRQVQVPTAVGTVVSVRAYVGGAQVASNSCTVSPATWQGGGSPLVGLFSDGVYILTCNNF